MPIKRFFASKDNTITNAMSPALTTTRRATGSNMGAADVLETFSIYGQASSSSGLSQELSRMLIQFPIDAVSSARTAGTIPASGDVSFYLKMFNAKHAFTLPRSFTLSVLPLSQSWEEGVGLDMEEYLDITYDSSGSNWINRGKGSAWALPGADYVTSSAFSSVNYTASFDLGYEDINLNITDLVEAWILGSAAAGGLDNYGVGVHFTGSQEAYYSSSVEAPGPFQYEGSVIVNPDGSTVSYYTKKFFSRSSEYFFKRPVLEARWAPTVKDDRGNFYFSSSLAPGPDNLNTLYLYNYVRGQLVDIPNVGAGAPSPHDEILLSIYSGSSSPTGSKLVLPAGGGVITDLDVNVTGGRVSTGIYSASFAATGSLEKVFDVWHSGSTEYFTSSYAPKKLVAYSNAPTFDFVTNVTNLKPKYSRSEKARMRLFVRPKNWNPNIYNIATATTPNETIISASYKIIRLTDNLEVISYGTGSDTSTYLSYDVSGNYFDVDMEMLEADYSYGMKLAFYNNSINTWVEQPYIFRFRVEEDVR